MLKIILIHYDKAQLTGTSFMKYTLQIHSVQNVEQLYTVDVTAKLDEDIVDIITKSGKNSQGMERGRIQH